MIDVTCSVPSTKKVNRSEREGKKKKSEFTPFWNESIGLVIVTCLLPSHIEPVLLLSLWPSLICNWQPLLCYEASGHSLAFTRGLRSGWKQVFKGVRVTSAFQLVSCVTSQYVVLLNVAVGRLIQNTFTVFCVEVFFNYYKRWWFKYDKHKRWNV